MSGNASGGSVAPRVKRSIRSKPDARGSRWISTASRPQPFGGTRPAEPAPDHLDVDRNVDAVERPPFQECHADSHCNANATPHVVDGVMVGWTDPVRTAHRICFLATANAIVGPR